MRSSDVIGVHIENFVDVHVYRFRGWVVQLLQFVVQPHLDGEPLPDEAHLVRAVLGREEFLPPLLHLALLGEVDAQAGAARRTLAVVHGLNAALHLRWCWWSVVPFRRLGPGQSSEKFHASSSFSSAADHVVLSKKEDFPRALSVPRVGAVGSKSEWLGFN